MVNSLLSKLGEITFTAEEQDAVVVTPDAVAIPAEDFACSLVGIYEISPNFFLIAFASLANRTNVLKRGPWDFQKYWFALEQADPNRTIHDYFFQHMCIWVRIQNIPLSLMTAALAHALGASVGKVIMTDTRLEDGNMGEFMRVRVSFDTSKPLRRCVVLSRPDAKASMCPLQYECLPLFCHGCGLIGHSVLACPTTPKVEGQKFQYGAWLRAPLPKRSASQPRGCLSVVDDDEDAPEMAAFVQGRAIIDNILIAHELVHTLHTSVSRSSQGAVFKLDMEKAFDRVEVRVRGALSEAIRPQRGLRQGDPLSPFLFLFCSEGLSAALTAAQQEGHLPGVRASKHGPPVNHLLFADDSLVFLHNNMNEVHCLKDILLTYSSVSGQKVNFSKSTAYFTPRTPPAHRTAVHDALGVQEVDDPGIYLGVPLLIGKNKYAAFGRYRDKRSVKVNVDGAFLPSARLGAVGVIARDSSGAALGGFAKLVPVHSPASTLEVSALFAGLEFAIANAWPSSLIESDAAVLVNKLHRPTGDLSLLGDMLAPSRALLAANAARLRVGFAPRLANTAAHTLASWACHNNDVISFSSVCPELISHIVLDDLSSSF
ncbi:hypothetical protein GQ457_10G010650 [Hibiscus cannabinus]